jgi:membrane protein
VSVAAIWPLAKEAGLQWVAHKDAHIGAALSYYSVFSLGPLISVQSPIASRLTGFSHDGRTSPTEAAASGRT